MRLADFIHILEGIEADLEDTVLNSKSKTLRID